MSEAEIVAAKFAALVDHLLNEEGRKAIAECLPRFIAGIISVAPADMQEDGLSALCDDVRADIADFDRFNASLDDTTTLQ
jgi:hypothetical protein